KTDNTSFIQSSLRDGRVFANSDPTLKGRAKVTCDAPRRIFRALATLRQSFGQPYSTSLMIFCTRSSTLRSLDHVRYWVLRIKGGVLTFSPSSLTGTNFIFLLSRLATSSRASCWQFSLFM